MKIEALGLENFIWIGEILGSEGRQAGRSHRLAVAFHLFVRGGHGDLFAQSGEFILQHLGGFFEDEFAARPRGNPA